MTRIIPDRAYFFPRNQRKPYKESFIPANFNRIWREALPHFHSPIKPRAFDFRHCPMKNRAEDSTFFWSIAAEFLNSYLPNVRRASVNTVESYRNCLNRYIDYLESEKGTKRKYISFKMLDRDYIKGYMSWMHKTAQLAPKTCNLRLTALHSLL